MQNDDGYVTYNFTWPGCLLVLATSIMLWCVLIYGTYNFVAWVLG